MLDVIRPYQSQVAVTIAKDIEAGSFPQAALFAGPAHSLKMTTALEVVRILSCEEGGRDDCRCPSCRRWQNLDLDNLIVLAQRDEDVLARCYADMYRRLRTNLSKRLLLRTVRTWLLAYHPALAETAPASQKNAFSAAGAVSDLLLALEDADERDEKAAQKWEKSFLDAVKKLLAAERRDTTLSIDQVRGLDAWCHQTMTGGRRQFVIIEGVEDANVSAMNSLLKMLEEPEEGVTFLILSSHPERMLPTLLSRLRIYRFKPLDQDGLSKLLAPCYPLVPCRSFDEFYLSSSGADIEDLRRKAKQVEENIATGRTLGFNEISQIAASLSSPSATSYFMQQVLSEFESDFLKGRFPVEWAAGVSRRISSMANQARLFNQDSRLLVQNLCLGGGNP